MYARPSEEAAARADYDDVCQLSAAWTALHAEIAIRRVPSAAVPAAAGTAVTEDVGHAIPCVPDGVIAPLEDLQMASATSEG